MINLVFEVLSIEVKVRIGMQRISLAVCFTHDIYM